MDFVQGELAGRRNRWQMACRAGIMVGLDVDCYGGSVKHKVKKRYGKKKRRKQS